MGTVPPIFSAPASSDTLTLHLPAPELLTEENTAFLHPIDVTASQGLGSVIDVTISLSDATFGSIAANTSSGSIGAAVTSSYDGTTGVWSAHGATGEINELLSQLQFTPAADRFGNATLSVHASGGGLTADDTLALQVTNVNDAPVVTHHVADQAATQDAAFSYTLPANFFADADGDPLSLTATKADGSALPSWLAFNAATGVFSGTPANADVGSLSLKVTASDGNGGSVIDSFNVSVANVNDAPVVVHHVADQAATQDAAFSYTLPANVFADADGDSLSLTATKADGSALPSWLAFNAATGVFSGTPANADVGSLSLKVTASDGNGGSVIDSFNVSVANVNDAPVVAHHVADQAATQDAAFSYTLPANVFADADGDTLSLTATKADGSALPSWLAFNAATGVFSGTPANADVGSLSLKVTANDGNGGSVIDSFNVSVANVNDAPVVVHHVADQAATQDAAFSYTLPANVFADADGDPLSLTATKADGSALPSWLAFNAATGVFSGTPANADVGSLSLKVTASDGNGGSVIDSFNVSVANVNDAPNSLAISAATISENSAAGAVIGALSALDPDTAYGDHLTYSLVSDPSGLFAVSGNNLQVAGAIDYEAASSHIVRVRVTDAGGLFTEQNFTIGVTDLHEAPSAILLSSSHIAENNISGATVATLSATDEPGDTETYSILSDASGFFSISGSTLKLNTSANYELTNTYGLTLRVTDQTGLFHDQAVTIGIDNVNEAPVIAHALGSTSTVAGSLFTQTLPAGSFTDPDGDPLTLTATKSDGSALPSWLTFNAATGTFSGTAGFSDIGSVAIKVTASDGSLSISNGGTLTVTDNLSATSLTQTLSYTEDTNQPLSAIVISGVASTVTASLTLANPLTGNLTTGTSHAVTSTYNAATGLWTASGATADVNALLSGVQFHPGADQNGVTSIAVSITDGIGTVTGNIGLSGIAVNDAPVLLGIPASATYLENTVNATPQLLASAATVTDVDTGTDAIGKVTAAMTGGISEDNLLVLHQGNSAGQIGLSGTTVSYGGIAIGSLTSDGIAGNLLEITLNNSASQAAIQALVKRIAYQDSSDTPAASHTVTISVIDRSGGLSDSHGINLTISPEVDSFTLTSGADRFVAGAENDTFTGSGADLSALSDTLSGGLGQDTLRITTGAAIFDTLIFTNFTGIETLRFESNAAHDIAIDDAYFSSPGFSGSTLTMLTTATSAGISFDASLVLAGHAVSLTGGGGNDTLLGGAGADTITFGLGDDSVDAGAGNDFILAAGLSELDDGDTLSGGAGVDTLQLTAAGFIDTSIFTVFGGIENIQFTASANSTFNPDDAYFATAGFSGSILSITQTASSGNLNVDASNVTLSANKLAVIGGGGLDSLLGGAGADTMDGGAGNDRIAGTGGADLLTGGTGNDIFIFSNLSDIATGSNDTITDFIAGTDQLSFSGLGLNYIHNNAFSGNVDEIRWQVSGSDVLVQIDHNGDGVADAQIKLTGVAALNPTDFIGVNSVSVIYNLTAGNDSFSGGVSTDQFTGSSTLLATTDTIKGGAGIDILNITGGTLAFNSATYTNFIGVEQFQLNANAAHTLTFANAYYATTGFVGNNLYVTSTSTTGININASAVNTAGKAINVIGGAGADTISGTASNDTIDGGAGNDSILGGSGNDSLYGNAGNDIFSMTVANFDANDSVSGGAGTDSLALTAGLVNMTIGTTYPNITGVETYTFNSNFAHVITLAESYYLTGGLAALTVTVNSNSTVGVKVDASGVTGATHILASTLGAGNDTILGGAGNDLITGGTGNDSLVGGGGADRFYFATSALTAADTVIGGAGNDSLYFNSGVLNLDPSTLSNVSGVEIFYMSNAGAHVLTLNDAYFTTGLSAPMVYASTASTTGVKFDASAVASATNAVTFTGYTGNDTLLGGAGADSLSTNTGNDSVDGAGGADTIAGAASYFTSADTLKGGAGLDTLLINAGSGNFIFDSSSNTNWQGIETFTLNKAGSHVVTLNDAYFSTAGFSGSTVTVSSSSTTAVKFDASTVALVSDGVSFTSNAAADTLLGGAGNDTFNSGNGNDSVLAGGGDDVIVANASYVTLADTISGGNGNDILRATSGTLSFNSATFTSFSGIERFELNSNASHSLTFADAYYSTGGFNGSTVTVVSTSTTGITVNASAVLAGHTLSILGGTAGDSFTGGAGDDTINGGDGTNSMVGGLGNDSITGGIGTDNITGGSGNDTMTGGAGADSFFFAAATDSGLSAGNRDVITDFTVAADKLNLSAFAGTFTFRAGGHGETDFSGAVSEVAFGSDGSGNTIVYVDTNGDHVSDFHIQLTGNLALSATDFVL